MPHVLALTDKEEEILKANGLDPARFGVTYRDEDTIRLLCYATRDNITINRGDRKW